MLLFKVNIHKINFLENGIIFRFKRFIEWLINANKHLKFFFMKIYLKNISCPDLEKLGIDYSIDELGIEITSSVTEVQKNELYSAFQPCNMVLTSENNGVTVKKIKTTLKDLLYYSDEEMKNILPKYLQQNGTGTPSYYFLDSIFKFETGSTIEEYFNRKKIDMAKKLLIYYNLSITEVTYQLGYTHNESLVEHFKMRTGITPTQFKEFKMKQMAVLEEV
jgi:AraC family transcriptional regulator